MKKIYERNIDDFFVLYSVIFCVTKRKSNDDNLSCGREVCILYCFENLLPDEQVCLINFKIMNFESNTRLILHAFVTRKKRSPKPKKILRQISIHILLHRPFSPSIFDFYDDEIPVR